MLYLRIEYKFRAVNVGGAPEYGWDRFYELSTLDRVSLIHIIIEEVKNNVHKIIFSESIIESENVGDWLLLYGVINRLDTFVDGGLIMNGNPYFKPLKYKGHKIDLVYLLDGACAMDMAQKESAKTSLEIFYPVPDEYYRITHKTKITGGDRYRDTYKKYIKWMKNPQKDRSEDIDTSHSADMSYREWIDFVGRVARSK